MNEKSSNCSSAVFCELIRSNDFSDVMEKETQFTNCIEMNSHTSAEFLALLQWNSLKQSWIILAFLGSISISSWVFFLVYLLLTYLNILNLYIRRVKSISLETVFAIFITIILISNMLYTSLFLTMYIVTHRIQRELF